MSDIDHYEGLK